MYKRGQIVLIKMHPASGAELKKFRPALIVATNPQRHFLSILPFTSNTKILFQTTEILLKPTATNGLEKPSLLLCWYLQTLGESRVQKILGELSKASLTKANKILKQHFCLL